MGRKSQLVLLRLQCKLMSDKGNCSKLRGDRLGVYGMHPIWHCGQWEIFFGLSSGPLITMTCMSIRGNTWTDALHAARFSCLTLSLYPSEVGWFLYSLVLFLWPIAGIYACGRVSLLSFPIFYSD